VCVNQRTLSVVDMSFGSAGDRVRIDFEERAEADELGDAATCFTSGVPHPTVRISIRLGAGADTYVAPPGLCASGGFPAVPMSITVDGQGGNDRISGTGEQGTAASDAVRNETLLGGAGDDRITGSDVASTIGSDSATPICSATAATTNSSAGRGWIFSAAAAETIARPRMARPT